ncbi:Glutamine synthetase, catalytic domain [Candidatus Methanoperedenaceae archaeon GB50]|nr:Glutamine synthetase, catalytic domain [Candidatus Methanoperedenaceae archaeon GB50]
MHIHQSLFKGDRNAFFDPDSEYSLSDIAKAYIAGLLRHSREICSVYAQSVNSYKRTRTRIRSTCIHRMGAAEQISPDQGADVPARKGACEHG